MFHIFSRLKKEKNITARSKSNSSENSVKLDNRVCCTVKEFACYYMGTSEAKANQLTNAEGFPMIRIGNNKYIILSKVDEWLSKHIGETF